MPRNGLHIATDSLRVCRTILHSTALANLKSLELLVIRPCFTGIGRVCESLCGHVFQKVEEIKDQLREVMGVLGSSSVALGEGLNLLPGSTC